MEVRNHQLMGHHVVTAGDTLGGRLSTGVLVTWLEHDAAALAETRTGSEELGVRHIRALDLAACARPGKVVTIWGRAETRGAGTVFVDVKALAEDPESGCQRQIVETTLILAEPEEREEVQSPTELVGQLALSELTRTWGAS